MSVGARLHVNPFLIRLALGATFAYLGMLKWSPQVYDGDEASRLVAMGVVQATPVSADSADALPQPGAPVAPGEVRLPMDASPDALAGLPAGGVSGAIAASTLTGGLQDGGDAGQPVGDPVEEDRVTPPPPVTPEEGDGIVDEEFTPVQPGDTTPPALPEPDAPELEDALPPVPAPPAPPVLPQTGPVEAKRLYGIAVMLHEINHPYPVVMAWVAFVTEVVGGLLLIVGLFSRIWGLGLAVAMGYAFTLTTLAKIIDLAHAAAGSAAAISPIDFLQGFHALEFGDRLTCFLQIALFVMALCILFGGPGAFSLDRVIFGRPAGEKRLITVREDV